jgi:hypothetical protein
MLGEMSTWSRLDGAMTEDRVAVHPDGVHAVRLVNDGDPTRVAVYDVRTDERVWGPDGVVAIDWSTDGGRVASLVSRVAEEPENGGNCYAFELREWPSRTLLATCEVRPPSGWLDGVYLSPRGDLAAFAYAEDGERGLELIDLDGPEAEQLRGRGWRPGGPSAFAPRFTPSGRLLVAGTFHPRYWLSDLSADEIDALAEPFRVPARGGRYPAARLAVFDCDDRTHRIFDVDVELPEGFRPEEDSAFGAIDSLSRLDDERLVLRFVTGDEVDMEIAPTASRT